MTSTFRAQFQAHPFHLVTPSPRPLYVSFALLVLASGFALYFQGFVGGGYIAISGLIGLLTAMTLRFRDVAAEGTLLGDHTIAVQKGLTLGFALFIVSEVFFFLAVFWARFHSALSPTTELGVSRPPVGIDAIDPFSVPLLNTIILLSSGGAVTYSHHSLLEGNRKGAIWGLVLTVVMATYFTALQGLEYLEAPFTIADSVFGSAFYFATGLHGLHVGLGTAFLFVCLIRIINYQATDSHHLGYESAIYYFHFVDVVRLFLYIAIYLRS